MSATIETQREELNLPEWARNVERSALQEMMDICTQPDVISFALGLPATELFPQEDYAQAAIGVLAADPRALQYDPPHEPLKGHVRALMARRGVECDESQIFLTSGAQQGLSLLARLLLEPGGEVLLEEMTYTGLQQVITPFRPRIHSVPTDPETGMDVEAVAALLEAGARPSFVYTVTDGHNPLGLGMSAAKRRRLVELARRYRVPVIEDDAYGFISYEGDPEPPMRALDDDWVLYVGSFSKILAPSLRVGWLVVPEALTRALSVVKESSDINTATFAQRTVSAYLGAGRHVRHIETIRDFYRERRDAMASALSRHFPEGARWRTPASGVFMWVELPGAIDTGELLRESVLEEKVAYVPGNIFCVNGTRLGSNCMRLNFSHCRPAQIEEGIARLGAVVKRALTRNL
jgi:2-aminoadipate transaminase